MMRRCAAPPSRSRASSPGWCWCAPAGAATPLTIGTGHKPGVAVDPAGTAYIAWFGPESNTTSLNFCRLPRGAGACDVATTIAAPGTTLSRPFVTVDGATVRVVSYRYGLTGARFDEIWEFTSVDGGATFDAGHPVGIAPFDEAVRGPGRHADRRHERRVHRPRRPERPARREHGRHEPGHPLGRPSLQRDRRARPAPARWSPSSPTPRATRRCARPPAPSTTRRAGRRRSTSATPTTRASPAARRACSCFGHPGERAHGAQVQRHAPSGPASRSPTSPTTPRRTSRRTRPGACTPCSPEHRRGAGARLRDLGQRHRLAVGAAADPTDAGAGHRQLRAAVAPDHLGVAAWETSSDALGGPPRRHRPSGAFAAGPGQVGRPWPRLRPGLRHLAGRQAHAADRGATSPWAAGSTPPRAACGLTSAATGTGARTQTADFYQGTFNQAAPAQGGPRGRA